MKKKLSVEEFSGLDLECQFKLANESLNEMRESLKDRQRELDLMEAGLESRPLDRDFFRLQKNRYENAQGELESRATILGAMKSMFDEATKDE